jgi:hypothetical protein
MSKPIVVDLPHSLGKQEATRRLQNGMGRIGDHLPRGAEVQSAWHDDRLDMNVAAMGQTIAAKLTVSETSVRVEVALPPLLSMFSGPIEGLLRSRGGELLEDKSKKG